MPIVTAKQVTQGRIILALCDEALVGQLIEECDVQLDLTKPFSG